MTRQRLASWEWVAIVVVLLAAAALRVARFSLAPPGLIHDETLNWLNAQLILSGDLRVLYPYGGGREMLYLLGQAASFRLIGDNLIAARLLSFGFSLLGLSALYVLTRRLLGRAAALVAGVGWASAFWSVMFARLGVRTGSMPALALIAAYLLVRGVLGHRLRAVPLGLALGLTLYTYPSALILPVVFLGWALLHSERLRGRWQHLGLAYLLALLLAVPLIRAWRDPSATLRADAVDAPLEALLSGDVEPVLENISPVLGIFTVRGDHGFEFNLEDKPIFPAPPMAGLFYAGLAIAVWQAIRHRDPRYTLLLLWLGGMLIPTLVTELPVNPSRPIGLMSVVFIFPAIALAKVRRGRLRIAVGALTTIALVWQLAQTTHDYFVGWATNPVTRFLYQDDFRQIAVSFDAAPPELPTALGGLTPDKMDPVSMRLLLVNDTLSEELGYFDPRTSLLLPEGNGCLVVIPDVVTLHPALAAWMSPHTLAITRGAAHQSYQIRPPALAEEATFIQSGGAEAAWLGNERVEGEASPGHRIVVLTLWQAERPSHTELRVFAHLTDETGMLLAQSDVLGVPATQWHPGDVIVQVHELTLPNDAPPGPYWLNIGMYEPATGIRLRVGEGDFVRVPLDA